MNRAIAERVCEGLVDKPVLFEQRFLRYYVATYHRYAQVALALGLALVLGDFVVDWLAHPGSVGRARPGRRLETDGRGQLWCAVPPRARFD